MGVVAQILPPSVQNGEEADLGAEVLGVSGNGAQRVGGGSKEQVITDKSAGWIETDGLTGRSVLKLPLPEPQVLQQLTVALSRLVAGLGS